jgi:tRNA/tmRNA/rRNA uracil-C5-methylase (TrmA/RlmC/RlmD family)/alkylated DNA repair dioxygenase AlkB
MTTAFEYCLPNKALSYDEQYILKQKKASALFISDAIIGHHSIPINYRNKLRFTIGYNEDYSQIVIGYNNPKVKPSIIYSAKDQIHLSTKMIKLIVEFETYLQDKLKHFPYDKKLLESTFINLFGNITIRTSFNINETMVYISIDRITNREILSDLIKIYSDLYSAFRDQITSFYIIDKDNGIEKILLFGKPYIYEKLNDLTTSTGYNFRISNTSFFQTNTYMTDIMYSRVKQLMEKYSTDSDVLFDLCCGTGTIGLFCSSLCKKVIGIDVCSSSIEDAKVNAKINSIKNCEFICDRIENVFDSLLDTYKPLNKFIIIDPPRSGLHGSMPELINNSGCNYVIYISCNQETMMRDIKLMNNYKIIERDFYDMYPFTDHYEVSCILERIEIEKLEKPFLHIREMFAENYFDHIKGEIEWIQDYFTVVNNGVETKVRERRLTNLQSTATKMIEYSGKSMNPTSFTKTVKYVKDVIEEHFKIYFDSCLINYYVNQEDYMRFHKDDVGVTKSPNIITVSFGETRIFQVRLRKDKEIKYTYELQNGDVFMMHSNCQENFDHSIPPVPSGETKGGRISLTFRVLNA